MEKINQEELIKRNPYSKRPIDISEDKKDYTISIAVPDFGQDDLKMNVKDDILQLSIRKKRIMGHESKKVYERNFKLPANANSRLISANVDGNILYVKIPKNTMRSNRII